MSNELIRQVLPRITCLDDEYKCTCWHHVTNHLIISNDKDSNTENIKRYIHIHDTQLEIRHRVMCRCEASHGSSPAQIVVRSKLRIIVTVPCHIPQHPGTSSGYGHALRFETLYDSAKSASQDVLAWSSDLSSYPAPCESETTQVTQLSLVLAVDSGSIAKWPDIGVLQVLGRASLSPTFLDSHHDIAAADVTIPYIFEALGTTIFARVSMCVS
jgi:hypothetical protein